MCVYNLSTTYHVPSIHCWILRTYICMNVIYSCICISNKGRYIYLFSKNAWDYRTYTFKLCRLTIQHVWMLKWYSFISILTDWNGLMFCCYLVRVSSGWWRDIAFSQTGTKDKAKTHILSFRFQLSCMHLHWKSTWKNILPLVFLYILKERNSYSYSA